MAQVEFPSGPDDTSVYSVGYNVHATGGTPDAGTLTLQIVVAGPGQTLFNGIETRISTTDVLSRFEDFVKGLATELDAQPSSTVSVTKLYSGVASTDEEPVSF